MFLFPTFSAFFSVELHEKNIYVEPETWVAFPQDDTEVRWRKEKAGKGKHKLKWTK